MNNRPKYIALLDDFVEKLNSISKRLKYSLNQTIKDEIIPIITDVVNSVDLEHVRLDKASSADLSLLLEFLLEAANQYSSLNSKNEYSNQINQCIKYFNAFLNAYRKFSNDDDIDEYKDKINAVKSKLKAAVSASLLPAAPASAYRQMAPAYVPAAPAYVPAAPAYVPAAPAYVPAAPAYVPAAPASLQQQVPVSAQPPAHPYVAPVLAIPRVDVKAHIEQVKNLIEDLELFTQELKKSEGKSDKELLKEMQKKEEKRTTSVQFKQQVDDVLKKVKLGEVEVNKFHLELLKKYISYCNSEVLYPLQSAAAHQGSRCDMMTYAQAAEYAAPDFSFSETKLADLKAKEAGIQPYIKDLKLYVEARRNQLHKKDYAEFLNAIKNAEQNSKYSEIYRDHFNNYMDRYSEPLQKNGSVVPVMSQDDISDASDEVKIDFAKIGVQLPEFSPKKESRFGLPPLEGKEEAQKYFLALSYLNERENARLMDNLMSERLSKKKLEQRMEKIPVEARKIAKEILASCSPDKIAKFAEQELTARNLDADMESRPKNNGKKRFTNEKRFGDKEANRQKAFLEKAMAEKAEKVQRAKFIQRFLTRSFETIPYENKLILLRYKISEKLIINLSTEKLNDLIIFLQGLDAMENELNLLKSKLSDLTLKAHSSAESKGFGLQPSEGSGEFERTKKSLESVEAKFNNSLKELKNRLEILEDEVREVEVRRTEVKGSTSVAGSKRASESKSNAGSKSASSKQDSSSKEAKAVSASEAKGTVVKSVKKALRKKKLTPAQEMYQSGIVKDVVKSMLNGEKPSDTLKLLQASIKRLTPEGKSINPEVFSTPNLENPYAIYYLTLLQSAAVLTGDKKDSDDLINYLIGKTADLNEYVHHFGKTSVKEASGGLTAFHLACCYGNTVMIEKLDMKGVDLTLKSLHPHYLNYTGLEFSILSKDIPTIKLVAKKWREKNLAKNIDHAVLQHALENIENRKEVEAALNKEGIKLIPKPAPEHKADQDPVPVVQASSAGSAAGGSSSSSASSSAVFGSSASRKRPLGGDAEVSAAKRLRTEAGAVRVVASQQETEDLDAPMQPENEQTAFAGDTSSLRKLSVFAAPESAAAAAVSVPGIDSQAVVRMSVGYND